MCLQTINRDLSNLDEDWEKIELSFTMNIAHILVSLFIIEEKLIVDGGKVRRVDDKDFIGSRVVSEIGKKEGRRR